MKKKNPLVKFTDKQLYTELDRRGFDRRITEYKAQNINGFTPKDIVCIKGCQHDWETEEKFNDNYGPFSYYYFYLKVDGKLFDIYYKTCATSKTNGDMDESKPSIWPEEDERGYNGALSLIPTGLEEASENCYEYYGKGSVKNHLKKHGITDFRVWNPKLVDKKTGRDKNYEYNLPSN